MSDTLPTLTPASEIIKRRQIILEKSKRAELLTKGSAKALKIMEKFVISAFDDCSINRVKLFFVDQQINLHNVTIESPGSICSYHVIPTKTYEYDFKDELIKPDYFEQELEKVGYVVSQFERESLCVSLP